MAQDSQIQLEGSTFTYLLNLEFLSEFPAIRLDLEDVHAFGKVRVDGNLLASCAKDLLVVGTSQEVNNLKLSLASNGLCELYLKASLVGIGEEGG